MKIKDGYILRNIADEWIIVPVGARLYDFNGLMTVNETGAFLWKLLQEERTRDELINSLISEYDIDIETSYNDLKEFIDSLIDSGVIENG